MKLQGPLKPLLQTPNPKLVTLNELKPSRHNLQVGRPLRHTASRSMGSHDAECACGLKSGTTTSNLRSRQPLLHLLCERCALHGSTCHYQCHPQQVLSPPFPRSLESPETLTVTSPKKFSSARRILDSSASARTARVAKHSGSGSGRVGLRFTGGRILDGHNHLHALLTERRRRSTFGSSLPKGPGFRFAQLDAK